MSSSFFCTSFPNFSDLQKLSAYNPENQLMVLTDASVQGLGFVLFQKGKEDKKWSIVWAGSTCLKASQPCWCPSKLELLLVFFALKKCHHFTFNTRHPVVVYSDCSGLKGFDKKDLPRISNHRIGRVLGEGVSVCSTLK